MRSQKMDFWLLERSKNSKLHFPLRESRRSVEDLFRLFWKRQFLWEDKKLPSSWKNKRENINLGKRSLKNIESHHLRLIGYCLLSIKIRKVWNPIPIKTKFNSEINERKVLGKITALNFYSVERRALASSENNLFIVFAKSWLKGLCLSCFTFTSFFCPKSRSRKSVLAYICKKSIILFEFRRVDKKKKVD